LEAKDFFKELFKNTAEHGNSQEPIFVCSAYAREMQRSQWLTVEAVFKSSFQKFFQR